MAFPPKKKAEPVDDMELIAQDLIDGVAAGDTRVVAQALRAAHSASAPMEEEEMPMPMMRNSRKLYPEE